MGSAVAVAAVTFAALAGVAHADPGAGVLVSGEPTLQGPIQGHAEGWLVERGLRVVEQALGENGRALVDCFVIEDLSCAQSVFDARAKASVLYLRVELVPGETREVVLTGHWFAKGVPVRAAKRACKRCDDAALRTAVGRLLSGLIEIDAPRAAGRSRLLPAVAIGAGVGLVAGGATYLYYGRLGGAEDPYRYPDATAVGAVLTAAGAVALVGGALWWRRVRPAERSARWTRIALVAGGAAAIAGGAVALRYASLRGADEPFVYPDAANLGAPLTIAGGAALVTGALLWWSNTPIHASVTSQGAVVGWAGRL